ncbi:MAG: aldo/keto reductase, partial [Candidatus Obscuribacterales bacterium]|nr:aldo/keto reductase [Candidatus Obscuribacterales bacterium]
DHVDSYVLHGPFTRRGLTASDWEVWTTMEELFAVGKSRILGVSNVNAEQLSEFCARAKTKPMLVQNRCYAIQGWDKEVRDICKTEGIIYQGFSLLTANTGVLQDPLVKAIAGKLGATAAQVIFRFSMLIGMLPLTGTTSARHMKEDLEAEKLSLLDEEVAAIESLVAR